MGKGTKVRIVSRQEQWANLRAGLKNNLSREQWLERNLPVEVKPVEDIQVRATPADPNAKAIGKYEIVVVKGGATQDNITMKRGSRREADGLFSELREKVKENLKHGWGLIMRWKKGPHKKGVVIYGDVSGEIKPEESKAVEEKKEEVQKIPDV